MRVCVCSRACVRARVCVCARARGPVRVCVNGRVIVSSADSLAHAHARSHTYMHTYVYVGALHIWTYNHTSTQIRAYCINEIINDHATIFFSVFNVHFTVE